MNKDKLFYLLYFLAMIVLITIVVLISWQKTITESERMTKEWNECLEMGGIPFQLNKITSFEVICQDIDSEGYRIYWHKDNQGWYKER